MMQEQLMKCVTVCQPYAHLIVIRDKLVENRTWPTSHRGELLIHAGKSRSWLDGDTDEDLLAQYGEPLVFGAIIGQARLIDCLHIDEIAAGTHNKQYPWLKAHAHTSGPWCWILADAERFMQPLPYRGVQKIFNVPASVFDQSAAAPR